MNGKIKQITSITIQIFVKNICKYRAKQFKPTNYLCKNEYRRIIYGNNKND